jgi:hypothetical protein
VAASISQGTPSDGKSVGRMLLRLPMVDFIAAVAAFTWASRCAGSAMWVPRLTRLIEAWLSAVVSPLSRSEIGTAATRLLRGSCASWRVAAQGAAAQHQHHVVDGGVMGAADVLQLVQRQADRRHRPDPR